MTTTILLSLAGAIIAAIVGTLWYSDKTPMGKIHMRSLGMDKLSLEEKKKLIEAAKLTMWKSYLAQMALSFLTAFATVYIVTMSVGNGVSFGLALGFVVMNWLCFMVPIIGSGIIWGNVDRAIAWPKFFSEISANLVTLILTALVASFFV